MNYLLGLGIANSQNAIFDFAIMKQLNDIFLFEN